MSFDYVFVGGGLQNCLAALGLSCARPDVRLALIERGPRLGGNHTWSFHVDDIPASLREVVDSLVVHWWPSYQVRFPDHERVLGHPYAAVTSERLDAVVRARLGASVLTDEVVEVRPGRVRLRSGRELAATVVLDARGPEAMVSTRAAGWQKFLGLELRFHAPVLPVRPVLMDAQVEQLDGYRFVYTLPFAADHGLVEDTYFSNSPSFDEAELEARVRGYCATRGWPIAEVVRRERGVLPLPWASDSRPRSLTVERRTALLRGGYMGGWFHPVTGYSFPVAARLADFVAKRAPHRISDGFAAFAAAHRRQVHLAYLLNWMFFRHVAPEARWNVLSRFYRMPEDTVRRFYALDLTLRDAARLLSGAPPRGMSLLPLDRAQVPG